MCDECRKKDELIAALLKKEEELVEKIREIVDRLSESETYRFADHTGPRREAQRGDFWQSYKNG